MPSRVPRTATPASTLDLPDGLGVLVRTVIDAHVDHGAEFSITVPRHKVIRAAIDGIDEDDFVTNRTGDGIVLDRDHRAHAVIEDAIRDLKHGAGLNHCPSGVFDANAAWLLAAILAYNSIRWTQLLGVPDASRLANAKTLRWRLLTIPGRLTRTARRFTLLLPSRRPRQHVFEDTFEDTLGRLRALPTPM